MAVGVTYYMLTYIIFYIHYVNLKILHRYSHDNNLKINQVYKLYYIINEDSIMKKRNLVFNYIS